MRLELRYPKISAPSEREEIQQIKSYLFSLVDQLQFALSEADATVVQASQSATGQALGWVSLGLSGDVLPPSEDIGRVGTGCYYRSVNGHIFVAFNCSVAGNINTKINAEAIPIAHCPDRSIYSVCVTDSGYARVTVTEDGYIWVKSEAKANWIDGYIDFWKS